MVPRKATSPALSVALALAVAVSVWGCEKDQHNPPSDQAAAPEASPGMAENSPFVSRNVTQIVFHPTQPDTLYVTVAQQGVFKSLDRGKSWGAMNNGLKSLEILYLVIDPARPETVYLGSLGAGVHRSDDGGQSWTAVNHGLTNTTIESLIVHPQTSVLYAATTGGGLFRSDDKGESWTSFNEGLPDWDHNNMQSFLAANPKNPSELYFANYSGVFKRIDPPHPEAGATGRWKDATRGVKGEAVSFFFYHPFQKSFYLVTRTGRLYESGDGERWSFISHELADYAVYAILPDPSQPSRLYAAVGSKGIVESTDHGRTWKLTHDPPPHQNVRVLTLDPQDPRTLYIGTANDGLWTSRLGEARWVKNDALPVLDWAVLMQSIQPPRLPDSPLAIQAGATSPPKAFKKCNTCHGWNDSVLNSNWHTFWHVTPTPRDWTKTVERMAQRSELDPKAEHEIIRFLNDHYGPPKPRPPA